VTAVMYLEDFIVGQTFGSGTVTVEADRIRTFAAEFDPQPFHLDETAARSSLFGELVASGWHTAALTMKLLVGSDLKIAGGSIGAGVEGLQWPRPVRPGDVLRIETEILEVRPSKSRPDRGIVKARTTTFNQNGQPVLVMVSSMIVPRRPA
jgi:acyl dehydratase